MRKLAFLLLLLAAFAHANPNFYLTSTTPADVQEKAVLDLIGRVLPVSVGSFAVKISPLSIDAQEDGEQDSFTLSSQSDKIVLIEATSGVAAASGFNYFLKYHLNMSISWSGDQLNLDGIAWPVLSKPIKKNAVVPVSYYQNVCTVSYSMAFWDWNRWQREIDWMAMVGINLPLAFNGQEYVWSRVFAQFNLTEADLAGFFAGPGFYAWQRMGNIRGWLGPDATTKAISDNFLKAQFDLQLQIVKRMSEFGMTPVLPAFAGHVPEALQTKFPSAKITRSPNWGNFPNAYCCDYLLEASDPLFVEIGSAFVREQMELYGNVSHVYNTDTFNEMRPSSSDPAYLRQSAAAVYESLAKADPAAVWLMQGWLFVDDPSFWQPAQVEALLSGVPDDGMLILDLFSEVVPVWQKVKSYYGKPFIYCMLNSFGGNNNLYGKIPVISSAPFAALAAPNSSMVGVGLTMEGINQNFVLYELMTEVRWHSAPITPSSWISQYHSRRYGKFSPAADRAWQRLLTSVYNNTNGDWGGTKSKIVLRPSLAPAVGGFMPTKLSYDPMDVIQALRDLVAAAPELGSRISAPFHYDVVDVTRQALSNLFLDQHTALIQAVNRSSVTEVAELGEAMLTTIQEMEALLQTDSHFSLEAWIKDARAWGNSPQSKDYLEWNARNQVTLWGPDGEISDYASKQWAGLVSSYYLPRWSLFVERLDQTMAAGKQWNQTAFHDEVMVFEQNWQHLHMDDGPVQAAKGNGIEIAKAVLLKYFTE